MNENFHLEKPQKLHVVEFYRFFAACGIVWYHSLMITGNASYPFCGGYVFVEFFFITTGYFSFQHIERHRTEFSGMEMKYTSQYVIGKMIRIFPYSTAGILLFCIVLIIFNQYSWTEIIKMILFLPFQIFFLPMAGLMPREISQYAPGLSMVWGPFWFLSVLLFVLPVILYIAIKKADIFYFYIVPFGAALVYGWLFMHYDSMLSWDTYNGLCFSGIIRGVAGILLGGLVYQISAWGHRQRIGKYGSYFLAIIELLCFATAAVLTYSTQKKYDAVIIILFLGCLSITFSGNSASCLLRGNIFIRLGEMALPLYCVHSVIYNIVQILFPTTNYYNKVGICFTISILLAKLLVITCKKWWPVMKIQRALFQ